MSGKLWTAYTWIARVALAVFIGICLWMICTDPQGAKIVSLKHALQLKAVRVEIVWNTPKGNRRVVELQEPQTLFKIVKVEVYKVFVGRPSWRPILPTQMTLTFFDADGNICAQMENDFKHLIVDGVAFDSSFDLKLLFSRENKGGGKQRGRSSIRRLNDCNIAKETTRSNVKSPIGSGLGFCFQR